ncbi:sugar-binding transcriptional regulator [Compostimonas suwonensis]|uniref:Deoxyribonucleoside regulator n=1 Tax=Compostimonas suwonensis TaxID=1048394 RepID=A0A2M9BU62_9MICO|nr:sugar-binding domain-containing protein [Compostimonas suwonensis]PJJ61488.1 deoxyribonucleoside regulator [Compostimonas suwonensis]
MLQSDELLSLRAAELYYEDDKTQEEIGNLLHITRWKVGRLLAQAKQNGFVRIEISHPRARKVRIERALRERYGLDDAVVVSGTDAASDDDLRLRVTRSAADYLTALRPTPRSLGVSWGRTLHDLASQLDEGWARGVDVVQVNGGVSVTMHPGDAAETAVTIANKGGGRATVLPSPAIFERVETKRAVETDRTVAAVLTRAGAVSAYLFSAGTADENSVLVDSGYLTAEEVATLVDRGAVGDVVGRFIDAQGAIVDHELNERTLGLGHDALRSATISIAVIAGAAKLGIARAVASSGLCTVLVTDEATASALVADSRALQEGIAR